MFFFHCFEMCLRVRMFFEFIGILYLYIYIYTTFIYGSAYCFKVNYNSKTFAFGNSICFIVSFKYFLSLNICFYWRFMFNVRSFINFRRNFTKKFVFFLGAITGCFIVVFSFPYPLHQFDKHRHFFRQYVGPKRRKRHHQQYRTFERSFRIVYELS